MRRLYKRLNQHPSPQFLTELRRAPPFPMKKLQCDNGSEFPLAFKLGVEAAGTKHRYITPRRPQQNGKVERGHRIDEDRQKLTNSGGHEMIRLSRWEMRFASAR